MCTDTHGDTHIYSYAPPWSQRLPSKIQQEFTKGNTFTSAVCFPALMCVFLNYILFPLCVICSNNTSLLVLSLRSRQSVWRAGSFWPLWGRLVRVTALRLNEPPGLLQPAWRAARQTSIVPPPGNAALMAVDTLAKPQPIYIKVKLVGTCLWALL